MQDIKKTKTSKSQLDQRSKRPNRNLRSSKINTIHNAILTSAIKYTEVKAVAGAGKTTLITQLEGHLVNTGVNPERILMLTFSNTARDTLDSRSTQQVSIKTCHAFCHQIITKYCSSLGIKRMEHLLDSDKNFKELKAAVRHAINGCTKDDKAFLQGLLKSEIELETLHGFFNLITTSKRRPSDLTKNEHREYHVFHGHLKSLKTIYKRFRERKLKLGLADFSDLIDYTIKILRSEIDLPYDCLFIDEYQDCSPDQSTLIKLLASRIGHVIVVCDPNQTIYGFAGATYTPIRDILANVKTYTLNESYRLTQQNAAFVNSLMSDTPGESLNIVGLAPNGPVPVLVRCNSGRKQEDSARAIVKALINDGVSAEQICVLARTKGQLKPIEQALQVARIEIDPLYRKHGIEHTLNVLKLVQFVECLFDNNGAVPKNFVSLAHLIGIEEEGKANENQILARLRRNTKVNNPKQGPLLDRYFIHCAKAYISLCGGETDENKDALMEINHRIPLTRTFADSHAMKTYLEKIPATRKVTTANIHQSKGREWEHVIVLGVTEGSIPFHYAKSEAEVREELNLLYVATTRATKQLYLLDGPYYDNHLRLHDQPSRFLDRPEVKAKLRQGTWMELFGQAT